MKNVLFIAGLKEEYYYLPFIEACEGRNLAIHIFDPSYFPEKGTISIQCNGLKINGFIDVIRYNATSPENFRLPISEIDIGWYLRARPLTREQNKDTVEKRFATNESIAAVRSLLSVLPCRWVNRKETVDFLASNKLYQQMVANRCGLPTPNTLISNDPATIVEFSDIEEGLLLKSLGYIRLDEEGKYFLYSQRFTRKELTESAEAMRYCPIFAQEYIKKHCEYRVMVIGDTILACKIDSQASEKTKVDWRHYDFTNVSHTASELPTIVKDTLRRFMREIGLQYGAIDLIEIPDGKFVFLEVNPSGQWGWIADLVGLPIPQVVADMLEFL